MKKLIVLSGDMYGRLTVVSESSRSSGKRPERRFEVVCDCGNRLIVHLSSLRSGHTKSCGCLVVEMMEGRATHGLSDERVFKIWQGMLYRCYSREGSRYREDGIEVCEEWIKSFENFLAYVGFPESDDMTIDRIDYHKNYEPGNVRWATAATQSRNRRGFKNNTSGVTGLQVRGTRYIAVWSDLSGKTKSKSFTVAKHGDAARDLAIEYRKLMIESLKSQGALYSDNHGNLNYE